MEPAENKNTDAEINRISVKKSSEPVKTLVFALAVMWGLSLLFGIRCWQEKTQANQMLATLMEDAQQLLNEKKQIEAQLVRVQAELEEKKAENQHMFNTLYPAYVAVSSIRYVGKDTNIYHYYDCELFSQFDTYTAHNLQYCELIGYLPCPICCP